jgi:long-chain acyl-CoA synthetase
VLLYGALRRGAVVVPLDPLLAERDVAAELDAAAVKLLFAWHARGDAAHRCTDATGAECELVEPGAFEALLARVPARPEVEPVSDRDPAVLLSTPRASGTPARAVLTHGRLDAAAQAAARRIGKTPEWITLSMLPPWHPAALTWAVNATLRSGGLLTLPARPDVGHALTVIARDRVRTVVASCALIAAMLRDAGRTFALEPTLARCVCGGPLPPRAVMHAFEAVFGCPVIAAGAAGAVAAPPGPARGATPALTVVGAAAST